MGVPARYAARGHTEDEAIPQEPNPTRLPDGLEPYRRTALFTESSLPNGLLKEHATKAHVWGLIQVETGRLLYRVTDGRREPLETVLTPKTAPGIVEPTVLHQVEPLGPVRFYVAFHRPAEPIPLCRFEELARRENALRAEDD